jgi:hypothetical protein
VRRFACFGLFLLVSTTLLLEVGVRWTIPQVLVREPPELWEPSASLGWRRRPDARVLVNSAGQDVEICTDARGDRIDCEAPEPTEPCRRRILVVGDSFVEALAVPFADTVWSRLAAETGSCAEVAGVGGWGLAQYVALTRERLEDPTSHYDLVMLHFYAGNDFTRDATAVPSHRLVELAQATRLSAPDEDDGDPGRVTLAVGRWLAAHSHVYVAALRARGRVDSDTGRRGDSSRALRRSTLRKRLLDESASGVARIAELAQGAGARLLVVVIPHDAQVLDPRGTGLAARVPGFANDIDMDLVAARFVPRIEAIPGVRVVDLLPFLREHATQDTWAADRHFSAEGHVLLLEVLRDPTQRLLAGGS